MLATILLTAASLPIAGAAERQLTHSPCGHLLTNVGVWSPDGNWIVYDVRSDAAGDLFDGSRIEEVNVHNGEVRVLYKSKNGAHCGVPTWHPREMKVVFILGPENPTSDWQYSASHRQGVMVDFTKPGVAQNLDARNLTPPFTPGALRGGSHVHVWNVAGDWLSFTYNDALVKSDVRDVTVAVPAGPVPVPKTNPHDHDGNYFCAVVTRTTAHPQPGSDEISRACEEGWIGTNGYVRSNGSRQKRALAFQGTVLTADGKSIAEVFVADLPNDMTQPGDKPIAGTSEQRPFPPKGVMQRRLTFTTERKFPGLQGPRHWLRSSPDGSRIAFLMRDEAGVVQIWTISPNGGELKQLTHNKHHIASAFTWSPDGKQIAHVMDNSLCLTDTGSGETSRLTPRSDDRTAPRPEACVFSPDGKQIAFIRRVSQDSKAFNQVFFAETK
jgi:WD40 repeat protein